MSKKINFNGGFEQGILEMIEENNLLSEKDKKRLEELKSKNQISYSEKDTTSYQNHVIDFYCK